MKLGRLAGVVAVLLLAHLLPPSNLASAEDQDVCIDQVPDLKTFLITAITTEFLKDTGALTDVYFSVQSLRFDDIGKITFHLTFSKRGELVKTMRYERVFRQPLRRLEVEQAHIDLPFGARLGGFCDTHTRSCGSVLVRVIGVCYKDK